MTDNVTTPAERQAAGRRAALELQRGVVAAGFMPAPPPEPEPPPAPVIEAHVPTDPQEAPAGGWWSHAASLQARGWRPREIDPWLGQYLEAREHFRLMIRDKLAARANAPDRVRAAILSANRTLLDAEIQAAEDDCYLTAQCHENSDLYGFNWELESARITAIWRHAPAILESLRNFEGADANGLRAEVERIRAYMQAPNPKDLGVHWFWLSVRG